MTWLVVKMQQGQRAMEKWSEAGRREDKTSGSHHPHLCHGFGVKGEADRVSLCPIKLSALSFLGSRQKAAGGSTLGPGTKGGDPKIL